MRRRFAAMNKPCFGRAFLYALLLVVGGPAYAGGHDANAEYRPTVLITGSNRGIGLEFVRQYSALDWKIIATCRDPEQAGDLKTLAARDSDIRIVTLDITDHAAVDTLARELKNQPIDVLLNNAAKLGDAETQNFGGIDYAQFQTVLAVNVIGPVKVSEAFVDHVAASRQKKIVTLGSAAGSNGLIGPVPNLFAYRSSKAGLHLAMHNMALALAERGIVVGLINPGLVDTRGILDLQPGDPVPEVFKPLIPLIESGQLELMRPTESVAQMIELIDGLTAEQAGQFLNFDGAVLPW